MMTLLAIGAIGFATCIGAAIIIAFDLLPEEHPLSIVCFGYGLGVGLIGLQLYVYVRFGIGFFLPLIVVPWIIFVIFLLFRKTTYAYKGLGVVVSKIDAVLIVFILGLLLFVIFESVLRPVTAWDAWSTWLLKSKIFFIDNGFKTGIFRYIESDYPLLISLMGTFIYTFIGSINDRLVLFEFSAFYVALSGVFFFTLLPKLGLTKSLLFTFLLISTQNLIRHGGRYEAGQADLALGYYFLIDTTLLLKYIKTKDFRVLILLNTFLGITSLIKNEGIPMSIVISVIETGYIIKNRKYKELFSLLYFLIPFLDWQLFKSITDMPKLPSYVQFALYPNRFFVIIKGFLQEAINIKNWNMLWIVFLVSTGLSLLKKSFKDGQRVILFLIYMQLTVYLLIFMNTKANPLEHIRDVFDRLLLHLAPIAMLLIAVIASGIIEFSKIKKLFHE